MGSSNGVGTGVGPVAFSGFVANGIRQRLGQLFLPGSVEIAGRNRSHALAGGFAHLSVFAHLLPTCGGLCDRDETGDGLVGRRFHRGNVLGSPAICSESVARCGPPDTGSLVGVFPATGLFRGPVSKEPDGPCFSDPLDRQFGSGGHCAIFSAATTPVRRTDTAGNSLGSIACTQLLHPPVHFCAGSGLCGVLAGNPVQGRHF